MSSGSSALWAIQAGLTLASPVCLLVGTASAASTSFSAFHRTGPKLLGWIFGLPLAFLSGSIIAPLLTPFFWTNFGSIWCSGFGWITIWGVISIFGRLNDELFGGPRAQGLRPERG